MDWRAAWYRVQFWGPKVLEALVVVIFVLALCSAVPVPAHYGVMTPG